MASEVVHGPQPKFKAPLAPGRYGLCIGGRYTTIPGLTAVGVQQVNWNSKRAVKRQAEALGMRTAFVCWFMATWVSLGGTWAGGVRAIRDYPFRRLKKQLRSRTRGRGLSLAVLTKRAARDREAYRLKGRH